ncbi:MAG: hypothetical protein R3321_14635, partial [Nitrososphaeraceae archaeon]|nr:hypothetical protein [Nitrososphaeraceae archaeon]
MAKNIKELDVTLEGKIAARLMLKEYDKAYSNLPNANLPEVLQDEFGAIFKLLTGLDEFPLTDYTFTISAKEVEGEDYFEFNRLYSPTVFLQDVDEEKGITEPYLYISWGSFEVKLQVDDDGAISTVDSGLALKLRNKKLNGYDTPCLVATSKVGKMTLSMPFPIRVEDIKTKADELELLLEADVEAFMQALGTKGGGGGNFKTFKGHTVKAGQLPLGEYIITDFRTYEH